MHPPALASPKPSPSLRFPLLTNPPAHISPDTIPQPPPIPSSGTEDTTGSLVYLTAAKRAALNLPAGSKRSHAVALFPSPTQGPSAALLRGTETVRTASALGAELVVVSPRRRAATCVEEGRGVKVARRIADVWDDDVAVQVRFRSSHHPRMGVSAPSRRAAASVKLLAAHCVRGCMACKRASCTVADGRCCQRSLRLLLGM